MIYELAVMLGKEVVVALTLARDRRHNSRVPEPADAMRTSNRLNRLTTASTTPAP